MNQPTPKIFQTGAMELEKGKDLATQSAGWGSVADARTLGAGSAFPWLSFGNSLTVNTEEDQSVTTKAFKTTPRMVGKMVENPLSAHNRFAGMNRFFYWMWGFEQPAKPVVAFKSTEATPVTGGSLAIGLELDIGTATLTLLRVEQSRVEKIYVFSIDPADIAQVTTIGTLSDGTISFEYTSHSGLMYEHTYELDASGRRYRPYTTAELALFPGVLTADSKKNLMATLGKRMSRYDLRYPNAVIGDFTYKIASAGLATWEGNFKAFAEERSELPNGYGSNTWTLTPGLCDGQLIPAHFEHRFFIGAKEDLVFTNAEMGGLTELGMSSIDLSVSVPLSSDQDTVSGLSIIEPEIEGLYDIKLTGTISRHSNKTYQDIRDNQDKVVVYTSMHKGWYMQEFLVKEATITTAGPDDGDIAQEPLDINVGFDCAATHAFQDWMEGVTEVQSSPVVYRVRDYSQYCEMVRN